MFQSILFNRAKSGIKLPCDKISVPVREEERNIPVVQHPKRGDHDHDLIIVASANTAPSGLDVVHHRRKRREIERYVVAERA